jgi:HrpA-like RNA helicase
MMFQNKLFTTNITEVSFTINGNYYVMDHMFGKYTLKHDKNM